MKNIRNFSIIAHINHGKSTLADRFIELCSQTKQKLLTNQILDSMPLERERGITIKSQCVNLNYTIKNKIFTLNIIDTPGHTDFSYEVSRALFACEGAILLIDASQGIEAQTLANYNKAIKQKLKIIPVLNKIDLTQSNPDKVIQEIKTLTNLNTTNIIKISAKTGKGIKSLIEKIIEQIPPPTSSSDNKLQALIIDSWFNNYLGIISIIKIKNGTLHTNEKIIVMSTQKTYKTSQLGIFTPKKVYKTSLGAGNIGFVVMGCKNINTFPIGDTITSFNTPATKQLDGFKKIKPKIYTGIFPIKADDFKHLSTSLSKLTLNDSSLEYKIEKSNTLGFGFRCGFLGILHMEIIQERLEREYNLQIIITPPSVIFKAIKKNGTTHYINNTSDLKNLNNIKSLLEPIALTNILTPHKYLGKIIQLCEENRGVQIKSIHTSEQVSLIYELPMSELIYNFFNKLKTVTQGFASLDYSFYKFKQSNLTKLSILINKKKVDTLEFIIHKNNALIKAKTITEKMKNIIPKHMFDITIQAAIDNKIIAKTVIKALKKNVLAKCYGGDITRKKKLLKKQALGKKRMKKIGQINIPQKAFLTILNIGE